MLTKDEEKVMHHLQMAINAFMKLSREESEGEDFCRGWRQCKNVILARGGRRG